jgi:hypothetical protein
MNIMHCCLQLPATFERKTLRKSVDGKNACVLHSIHLFLSLAIFEIEKGTLCISWKLHIEKLKKVTKRTCTFTIFHSFTLYPLCFDLNRNHQGTQLLKISKLKFRCDSRGGTVRLKHVGSTVNKWNIV